MKFNFEDGVSDEMISIMKSFGKQFSDQLEVTLAEKGFTKLGAKELKELKDEIKSFGGDVSSMSAELEEMKAKGVKTNEEPETLEMAFKSLLESDQFKTAKAEGFKGSPAFELKVSSTAYTGNVAPTQLKLSIGSAPDRQLAFVNLFNQISVGADKDRVAWIEGTYTSNVGYVGEGTKNGNNDSATAKEKDRKMAKYSAILPLTNEMLTDYSLLANFARTKMNIRCQLFQDGEIYDGDGSDATNPNHIYGVRGQSTAFDASLVSEEEKPKSPNIGDVINACLVQMEEQEFKGANFIAMHPRTFLQFRYAKDADGNYLFVQDINGGFMIAGLSVIRTTKLPKGELFMGDSSLVDIYNKQSLTIKFTQMDSDDISKDMWKAIAFGRTQVVVETFNQKGLILVDSLDDAITALTPSA